MKRGPTKTNLSEDNSYFDIITVQTTFSNDSSSIHSAVVKSTDYSARDFRNCTKKVVGLPQRKPLVENRPNYHGGYDNLAFQVDTELLESTASPSSKTSSEGSPSPSSSFSYESSSWDQKIISQGGTDTGISINDSDASSLSVNAVSDGSTRIRISDEELQHSKEMFHNDTTKQKTTELIENASQSVTIQMYPDPSARRNSRYISYTRRVSDISSILPCSTVACKDMTTDRRGTRREYKANLRQQLWSRRNYDGSKPQPSLRTSQPNAIDSVVPRRCVRTTSLQNEAFQQNGDCCDDILKSDVCHKETCCCSYNHDCKCNKYIETNNNNNYVSEMNRHCSLTTKSYPSSTPSTANSEFIFYSKNENNIANRIGLVDGSSLMMTKKNSCTFPNYKGRRSNSGNQSCSPTDIPEIWYYSTGLCSPPTYHEPRQYNPREKSCPPACNIPPQPVAPYQRRYKRARSVSPARPRPVSPSTAETETWVGVHHSHKSPATNGDQTPTDALPCVPNNCPSTPSTPHIVVSSDMDHEDEPLEENNASTIDDDQGETVNMDRDEQNQVNNEIDQAARHNSITSYLLADVQMQRNTRRNSMIGLMHRASSVNNLNLTPAQQQHLTRVASASNLGHGTSKTSLAPSGKEDWKREGNDSMIACLSALYGKILVVMGLAFPIGEFISGEMPLYIYKGFYLYLHIGSILFLLYAYMFLLHVVPLPKVEIKSRLQSLKASTIDLGRRLSQGRILLQQDESDKSRASRGDAERAGGRAEDSRSINTLSNFQTKNYTITESTHESMYLKMGAMVFGIGSMIYSGLEVGQYFDLKSTPECADMLLVISPVSRMIFTFIQMYFIFLNSRVAINKHRIVARFGLMHMIATNLCIWLNVLVEETKHEIHSLTHAVGHMVMEDYDDLYGKGLGDFIQQIADNAAHNASQFLQSSNELSHEIVRRSADAHHPSSMYDCRQSDMMSRLVDNASPFLFPCTIEYSLLCSGVLYVIWKNINKAENSQTGNSGDSDISTFIARKARHHYSVDCAHATRGLFMGILVLVLTIISLILFFVLINNEEMKSVAILEANIIELSVYSVAILTVVIAMVQMRELEFVEHGEVELDNILLLIAQTGTYIYTSFTIIGGNFSLDSDRIMPFFTAVITLIQTTLQTLFILNASRRCCSTYDQLNRKPGREMVTFLLICNLAMWAICTFETSRADAHPTLLNYYGVWAWTIISHVSMPLAIFYRFHVTVCLCEIWKRSYKLKHDFLYMHLKQWEGRKLHPQQWKGRTPTN